MGERLCLTKSCTRKLRAIKGRTRRSSVHGLDNRHPLQATVVAKMGSTWTACDEKRRKGSERRDDQVTSLNFLFHHISESPRVPGVTVWDPPEHRNCINPSVSYTVLGSDYGHHSNGHEPPSIKCGAVCAERSACPLTWPVSKPDPIPDLQTSVRTFRRTLDLDDASPDPRSCGYCSSEASKKILAAAQFPDIDSLSESPPSHGPLVHNFSTTSTSAAPSLISVASSLMLSVFRSLPEILGSPPSLPRKP